MAVVAELGGLGRSTIMTPPEIVALLKTALDDQTEERVVRRLELVDASTLFQVLFPLSVRAQGEEPVLSAARVLYKLNVRCPITCSAAVSELLSSWDVSLEEVPFYLAKQFGASEVLRVVGELEASISLPDQKASLGTVRYWMGCYQEMQIYRFTHDER